MVSTLVVTGYIRETYIPMPPMAHIDMNTAGNWLNYGVAVFFVGLALARTVVGVLQKERDGALAEVDALSQAEALRRKEADEGVRLLALEAQRTRTERMAAAGRAAAAVAHDLNNAVHGILMAIELMAGSELSEEQVRTYLLMTMEAVSHAEALASQFDIGDSSNDTMGSHRSPIFPSWSRRPCACSIRCSFEASRSAARSNRPSPCV
jgi:signal transduction histidine kinase